MYQAHTSTEVAVVVVVSVEVRTAEVHAVRVAAIVVRGRPVVAVAADKVDRSPIAVACGRQEDRTVRLQTVCPTRCTYHVAAIIRIAIICATQAVVTRAPVIGQQNHAIHVIHLRLCVADAAARTSRVENVSPFLTRQRPPLVGHVAAVAYHVVAPVGLASLVVKVVGGATVGVVIAITSAGAPWLITYGTVVVAARAPAKQINPAAVGRGNVSVSIANVVVLVGGKLPSVRAGEVLQIALREIHALAGTHRETAVYNACREVKRSETLHRRATAKKTIAQSHSVVIGSELAQPSQRSIIARCLAFHGAALHRIHVRVSAPFHSHVELAGGINGDQCPCARRRHLNGYFLFYRGKTWVLFAHR